VCGCVRVYVCDVRPNNRSAPTLPSFARRAPVGGEVAPRLKLNYDVLRATVSCRQWRDNRQAHITGRPLWVGGCAGDRNPINCFGCCVKEPHGHKNAGWLGVHLGWHRRIKGQRLPHGCGCGCGCGQTGSGGKWRKGGRGREAAAATIRLATLGLTANAERQAAADSRMSDSALVIYVQTAKRLTNANHPIPSLHTWYTRRHCPESRRQCICQYGAQAR